MLNFNSAIDEDNARRYHEGNDVFICMVCEDFVKLDNSYSNRGRKLICSCCCNRIAHILNMSVSEILSRLHEEV